MLRQNEAKGHSAHEQEEFWPDEDDAISHRSADEHRPLIGDDDEVRGVAESEHTAQYWSKTMIVIAWCSIELLSLAMALVNQTITIYTTYATSEFQQLSLLSTIAVVQGVLNVVARPPMAKIADVIGRFEGFLISVVCSVIGFIMLAKSPNIETYFAAQVFYTIGQMGTQFMIQVFATDTSSIAWRAVFIILPNVWYVFVPWVGGPLTTAVLSSSSWRWGIAMWAIIVPVCSLPLLSVLLYMKIKICRIRGHTSLPWTRVLSQMDLGGSLILACGLALLFVAIPLASADASRWESPETISMIGTGVICLALFPLYERLVPRYPIMSFSVFKNLDIAKAFVFIALYHFAFYIYYPYFFAWLLVVFDLSNTAATNVSVVGTVAATTSGFLGAASIGYTRNVKWYIVAGSATALVGLGLIYHFRRPGSTVFELVVAQLVDGTGSGVFITPSQVLVQSYASHAEVAQTTALYLSFLALGQVVGDAISGAIYRSQYPAILADLVPQLNATERDMVMEDVTYALRFPIGSTTRDGINAAFNEVMRILLIPPLVLFGIMFLLSLTFREVHLDKISEANSAVILGSGRNKNKQRDEEVTASLLEDF